MTEAVVIAVQGDRFRVEVNGAVSGLLPRLATAGRLSVDFEARTAVITPPQVGDRVLVAFTGKGYGWGWILGVLEGGKA